jgi:CheY-like chemotaxis protein
LFFDGYRATITRAKASCASGKEFLPQILHPSAAIEHLTFRFVYLAGSMATILSVDDELNPLVLRKLLLESAGHLVINASSGREALRILKIEKPDIVLTDQAMPAMTGAELAREIKARNPEMLVIIITGLNDVPDAAAADLVMHKLERRTVLLSNIERILNGRSDSSAAATASSSSAQDREPS